MGWQNVSWRTSGVRYWCVKIEILLSHPSGHEKQPAVYMNLNLKRQVQDGVVNIFQHMNVLTPWDGMIWPRNKSIRDKRSSPQSGSLGTPMFHGHKDEEDPTKNHRRYKRNCQWDRRRLRSKWKSSEVEGVINGIKCCWKVNKRTKNWLLNLVMWRLWWYWQEHLLRTSKNCKAQTFKKLVT